MPFVCSMHLRYKPCHRCKARYASMTTLCNTLQHAILITAQHALQKEYARVCVRRCPQMDGSTGSYPSKASNEHNHFQAGSSHELSAYRKRPSANTSNAHLESSAKHVCHLKDVDADHLLNVQSKRAADTYTGSLASIHQVRTMVLHATRTRDTLLTLLV